MIEHSDTIGKLAEALAKAQGVFSPVKRSVKVDFTTRGGQKIKYSYAPLADVFDACRKGLSENGLAIMQPTRMVEGKLVVETLLCHLSGEWIKSEILIESQDKNPQSEGSALTYAKRYGISSLLCVAADEDDDAEAATDRTKPPAPPAKVVPKASTAMPGQAMKETTPPNPAPPKAEAAPRASDAQEKAIKGMPVGTFISSAVPKTAQEAIKVGASWPADDVGKNQEAEAWNLQGRWDTYRKEAQPFADDVTLCKAIKLSTGLDIPEDAEGRPDLSKPPEGFTEAHMTAMEKRLQDIKSKRQR